MLKIDLLPKTIRIAQHRNIAMIVVAVAVAAEIGILLSMRGQPLSEQARLQDEQMQTDTQLKALQAVGSESQQVAQEASGYQPKFDFVDGMLKYNTTLPGLYRRTAAYTYGEVMMTNLEATNNQLRFNAYVTNVTDISRLMLGLSRNTQDFAGLPQVAGNPAYDPAREAQERDRRAESGLPGSGVIGGSVTGSLTGGAGMGAGTGAGAGGMNSSMGYASMMAGRGAGGPAGGMGPMPGMMSGPGGAGAAPGMMSGPGGGSPYGGGMAGGPGGTGGGGDINQILGLQAATRPPRGFMVTVTVPLKQLAARPNYGSAASQAGQGGGGGGGGMGGGMGGYAAMMGSMGGGGAYGGGGMSSGMSSAGMGAPPGTMAAP